PFVPIDSVAPHAARFWQRCALHRAARPDPSLDNNKNVSLRMTISLHPAALRRTAAVVRNRRDVTNGAHFQTSGSQSADSRLATGAGTADAHFKAADTVIARHIGGVHGRLLRGKGRAFARTAE